MQSVRKARHDVRASFSDAMNTVLGPILTDANEAMVALSGQRGLAPDEQAERLKHAASKVADIAAALEPIATTDATETFQQAVQNLLATAEFAATRDFEAHQEAKAEAGEGALPALDGTGFVTPPNTIGDLLAASLAPALAHGIDGLDDEGDDGDDEDY